MSRMPVWDYANLVLAGLYAVGAPLAFLWPMRAAHALMGGEKERVLGQLAHALNCQYDLIKSRLLEGPEAVSDGDFQRLRQLEQLRRMVESLPAWPIEVGMLRTFLGT